MNTGEYCNVHLDSSGLKNTAQKISTYRAQRKAIQGVVKLSDNVVELRAQRAVGPGDPRANSSFFESALFVPFRLSDLEQPSL